MNHDNTPSTCSGSTSGTTVAFDDADNMSLVIKDEGSTIAENCSAGEQAARFDEDTEDSGIIEDEASRLRSTNINDLPDEVLENIFTRVSPYNDFDSIKCVCRKWNSLAQNVVGILRNTFNSSLKSGTLECVKKSAVLNEKGFMMQPWISERFGHMCCYCDKKIFIMGGTTYTPTTFNDLWSFDLSTRTWSRVIAGGQYPSPKALGSFVKYRSSLVLFGGWSHPSPYPLMQPWRIFDELHLFDTVTNRWTLQEGFNGPPPTAGHSATVHGDVMTVFGGRTFDQENQSFPLSGAVWVYDFKMNGWYRMKINGDEGPLPRYGQTQIEIDDYNLLVIGGCGGPNQIMSDVWLLTMSVNRNKLEGKWTRMATQNTNILDFHYEGCKVGPYVIFFERSSPISPFLAFLHFDSKTYEHGEVFRRPAFQSNCSSGLRNSVINTTMPLYALDISKVLVDGTVQWTRDTANSVSSLRPNERLLYTAVPGRCEIILFGGFYKDPNANHCRVSSDIYFIGTPQKTY